MRKLLILCSILCLVGSAPVQARDNGVSQEAVSTNGMIGIPIDIPKDIKTRKPIDYHPFDASLAFIVLQDNKRLDDEHSELQEKANGNYARDSVFFQSRETLNHVLLYPSTLSDGSLQSGDTVSFTIPDYQEEIQGQPLMIYRGKGRFEQLCGMLQLDISEELLRGVGTLTVEVDTMHYVAGMCSVKLSSPDLELTPLAPSQSLTVDVSASGHVVCLPIPAGKYEELKVILGDENEEVGIYEFKDVRIERGYVTKLSITPNKGSKCDKVGSPETQLRDGTITYDPSPIGVDVLFGANVVRLWHARLQTFHNLPGEPVMPKSYHIIYDHRNKSKMDVYGRFSAHFDNVELFPGYNGFYSSGIVMRNCSVIPDGTDYELSKFVRATGKTLKLFLKTYTDPFDYKLFVQRDSLGGYVPEWNKPKWHAPITSVCWKFHPLYSKETLERTYTRWLDRSIQDDNHFKLPLVDFWERCCVKKDVYKIVRRGVVDFQTATVYTGLYPDKTHWEWSEDPCSFSTDIVGIDPNAQQQSNGMVMFTGRLGISAETMAKLKGKKPIFKSSYFDGYERGFIVIDAEDYKASDNLPEQIEKNKHVCKAKSGDTFTCDISGLDKNKTYYIWAYLQIDEDALSHYLFVSSRGVYPTPEGGIFGNVPSLYKESLPQLTTLTKNYIDEYKLYSSKKGNKKDDSGVNAAYQALVDYYTQVNRAVGFSGCDTEGQTIPYVTEGDLPYTIVSPVRKLGIGGPPEIFQPIGEYILTDIPLAAVKLAIYASFCNPVTMIDELPLYNIAIAQVDIRIDRIESTDNGITKICEALSGNETSFYMPNIHVSEMGADGKSHNFIHVMAIPTKELKVGDVVTIKFLINGWGSVETLDNMRSLVFNNVDETTNLTQDQTNSLASDYITVFDAVDSKKMNQWFGPK